MHAIKIHILCWAWPNSTTDFIMQIRKYMPNSFTCIFPFVPASHGTEQRSGQRVPKSHSLNRFFATTCLYETVLYVCMKGYHCMTDKNSNRETMGSPILTCCQEIPLYFKGLINPTGFFNHLLSPKQLLSFKGAIWKTNINSKSKMLYLFIGMHKVKLLNALKQPG